MGQNNYNVDTDLNRLLAPELSYQERVAAVTRVAEYVTHLNELKRRKLMTASNLSELNASDILQHMLQQPNAPGQLNTTAQSNPPVQLNPPGQ